MCGIHLIVSKQTINNSLGSNIKKMMGSTPYRGPDHLQFQERHLLSSSLYFGINQLYITDSTEKGFQPFHTSDKGSVLIYNGEVYNTTELRKHLVKKGKIISGSSDTELLFHLLESSETEDVYSRLNGMFAFVYFNPQQQKLVVARDRSGIKPIYYYESDQLLIVSSELKSIIASELVEKQLNSHAVDQYLQFRYCQYPETFFKNIYELPPQKELSLDLNSGKSEIRKYNVSSIDTQGSTIESELPEQCLQILSKSVDQHLSESTPSTLLLSGGVDSTLLLSLIRDHGLKHFPAYHLSFNQYPDQELDHTIQASKLFDADLKVKQVDESVLEEEFSIYINQLDQPIGDSGSFATYLLAREMHQDGFRVALSGAGADELFGGYNRHWMYYQYLNYPWLFQFLKHLPTPFKGELFRLLGRAKDTVDHDPEITYQKIVSFLYQEKTLMNLPDWKKSKEVDKNMLNALQYDRNRYLVSDILALNDKSGMLHSVEIRTPYLDRELLQFANKLSPEYLLRNGRKWILKKLLTQTSGTSSFSKRRKKGFGLPFNSWIISNSNLFEFIDHPNHILFTFVNRECILDLYRSHLGSNKDRSLELWNVLLLARWLESHIN